MRQQSNQPIRLGEKITTKLQAAKDYTGLKIRRYYSIKKDCQICKDLLLSSDILRMNCGDTFHRHCIFEFLKNKIQTRSMSLRCPQDGCSQKLSCSLLQHLGFSNQELTKYFGFQLDELLICNQGTISNCPTPGCPHIFVLDKQLKPFLFCEICLRDYCMKCKTDAHPLYTCPEFQLTLNPNNQEAAFQEIMEQQHCKKCSKCQAWISKTKGCNHMKCRCGYEFCYKCGRIYKDKECRCPLFDREP